MKEALEFAARWLPWSERSDPSSATACELGIFADGAALTTLLDKRSLTVRSEMRVAAFELAQWLAFNWWRIRWEPFKPTPAWRESHSMAAIGGGTVWPDITLVSDLQTVDIVSSPTEDIRFEPIRFITPPTDKRIRADSFERSVDSFFDLVVGRLQDLGVRTEDSDTFLELVRVLRIERAEPATARYRQMEATLGFDPDHAPEHLMLKMEEFASNWGESATQEVAASSRAKQVATILKAIANPDLNGIVVNFESLRGLRQGMSKLVGQEPWRVAAATAQQVRRLWSLGEGKLRSEALSQNLGISVDELQADHTSPLTIGVATNGKDANRWHATLRKRHPTSRRFEVSRLIGDYIIAPKAERLLPMTDAKTARQQFQRAFAQELLAPTEKLKELVGPYPDDDAIETAASHFDVSPHLVATALVNKNLLDRSYLPDRYGS